MNMESSILPAKLRELRRSYGYTQDYVASFLGVVRQTYSHYETGKRTPNPESLYKLAGLYRISVDDLMQFTLSLDKNIYYDSPAPSSSSIELTDFLEYFNNPNKKKKYLYNTNLDAYSAKPAQPFQWNGALFRFNLNVVQID